MPGSPRRPHLVLIGLAFFLSGAAALAYQVAWQRILALHTGVGLYSIAVIVAVFMAGLGLGSRLGAATSTKVTAAHALVLFAACELGIAAYGAASCWMLYDWLYVRHGSLYADPLRGALMHLATLALPTVLMGMSLPLLTRAVVRQVESAAGTVAFLYGVNVLGAAAGALATPWVFFRHHGVRAAVMAAVAANLVAGSSALALALWGWSSERTEAFPERDARASAVTPGDARGAFGGWIALYATSGFCALALEMLWFRIMEVSFKSTSYTFGTLLALYLFGSGVGAIAGITLAPRIGAPRRAFLACQCTLLAYAGAAIAILAWIPPTAPGYEWFYDLWGGRRSYNLGGALYVGSLLRLYVALPLALFGIPTVLMGLSYPILQRAVQDDAATSGWKVGVLQAANIVGCVAGSLLVGLGTLTWLGTTGTFRLLALVGLLFAGLGLREPGGRRLFLTLAALLAVVAAVLPSQRRLWLRLHGTAEQASLLEEDATGVVVLVPEHDTWKVWAGGRWHSRLPFGEVHTALGAAPAIIHPAPRDVAIIGLGSGDTAASSGCRRDVDQRITVFELYAPEHRLLSLLGRRPDAPAKLSRFLEDPRFAFRIADGRNAIDRGGRLYDLIEADALWPTSPYSGNLYSLEFFQMCANRLRPGGLVTTWLPTRRVRATFLAALPYVVELTGGNIAIGSRSPIPIDTATWRERLFDTANTAYLGRQRAMGVWMELQGARLADRAADAGRPINRDLFPRDEFNTPN
jgi:predicted membrane-bound spermidine synthase